MKTNRATTLVAAAAMAAGPALAQVAPAPAPAAAPAATVSVASLKAGWIALAVSFVNGKIGDVPLASAVLGAAENDGFAVLAKKTSSRFAGLVLRGELNAPETGTYGLLLDINSGGQTGFCNYSVTVDGTSVMAYRSPAPEPATADKAVQLTAGRHPILIEVGCGRPNVAKVLVGLKVKLPSADAVSAPPADFIVHVARPSGD